MISACLHAHAWENPKLLHLAWPHPPPELSLVSAGGWGGVGVGGVKRLTATGDYGELRYALIGHLTKLT